ncbi:Flp family type IVb pilin [Pseudorhodobacter sp.]|uniref:Flp family type IVb pilin n=1 Tax=Pseudorhodobacter sp. TaxID=1934400 RepID=UPI002648ADCF|nr:hypothetical protein [Pseudorhodobacter sp.]MDN5788489.1 hypothetical protein [Pseudorhodobacter sp.]
MKLMNAFQNFAKDESGAVTVDWVVLTAAIVGLGLVVMNTVGAGVTNLGNKVATDLSNTDFTFEGR